MHVYMLIKVDVDPDIVYNMPKAHTYAQNHCDKIGVRTGRLLLFPMKNTTTQSTHSLNYEVGVEI